MFSRIASALSVSKPRANSGDATPSPGSSVSGRTSPGFSMDPSYGLASLLVDKSKAVKLYPQYREPLIEAVMEQLPSARALPGAHTDSELITIAKHTCTIDWVQKAIELFDRTSQSSISQLPPDDAREFIKTKMAGVALVLAQGFDKVEEKKFIRDASGKIIGIDDERQPECNRALQSGELIGGKRKKRQTKKRQQKKRKTLRRTRH